MAFLSPEAARVSRSCLGVLNKAFRRALDRDVMLYVGGVSFFALLAVFPALSLLINVYSAVFTPEEAAAQAERLAHALPVGAQTLFQSELERIARTNAGVVSGQSAFVLVVGAYAAHRGVKALLAGLTFVHGEKQPHGFLRFNLLAALVAVGAFALFTALSGVVVVMRVFEKAAENAAAHNMAVFDTQWLWAGLGLISGLTLLYRYAMSHSGPVLWPAALAGGASATALALFASWASAFYVERISTVGVTYGSVAAVVVFLIWLSWNVTAVFYGGALATEIENRIAARKLTEETLEASVIRLPLKRVAFRR